MPILALLLAAQDVPKVDPKGDYYQPSAPTIIVEPVAMMLAGFDSDGDGRVTRAEADAGVARSFAAVAGGAKDIGYIGFSDWAERWLGNRNAVPSPFETDRDGDNRITLDELQTRIGAIFARLDADHDGVLTHKELVVVRASGQGFGPQGGRGGPEGKRPPRR